MNRLIATRSVFRYNRILPPILHLAPYRTLKLPKFLQVLPNAVDRANEIDRQYKQTTNHPTDIKIQEIIKQVEGQPDLLYQLGFFFYKCKKLGITHDNVEYRKKGILYWVMFLNNLMPLNGAFWSTMQMLGKSQHNHRLNPFKVNDIGLLDPKNFPKEFYNQLLTGRYRGVDFRDRIVFSLTTPKWEDPEVK